MNKHTMRRIRNSDFGALQNEHDPNPETTGRRGKQRAREVKTSVPRSPEAVAADTTGSSSSSQKLL